MKINFDEIPDQTGLIADGEYDCQVIEAIEKTSKAGNDYWNLKLQITGDTPFSGWTVYDSLFFSSEKALQRAKLVLSSLGIATKGEVDLKPEELIGRKAVVTVYTEEYEDYQTSEMRKKNGVPFAGYKKAGTATDKAKTDEKKDKVKTDKLPF